MRTLSIAALALFLSPLAAANEITADCSGWSTSVAAPEAAGSFYVEVTVRLQRETAPGFWTDHEISLDAGFLAATNTDWDAGYADFLPLGKLWSQQPPTGTYRACMEARMWGAGHPFPSENAVIGADNYVWTSLAQAQLAVASNSFGFTQAMPAPVCTETEIFCIGSEMFPDAKTPGYWKNHPEAWPTETLAIGNLQTAFPKSCLIQILQLPVRGDMRIILLHHLISAKLNILAGCDPDTVTGFPDAGSTVLQSIALGDTLIQSSQIQCSSISGNAPTGAARLLMETDKTALDAYNNNAL